MDDATQAAAVMLLKGINFERDGSLRFLACSYDGWEQRAEGIEARLVERVRAAQAELRSFQESRGFRLALDAMVPGWRYVDTSEHLPQDQWYAFVSNEPDAWLGWLVRHGVDPAEATEMVDAAFGREEG